MILFGRPKAVELGGVNFEGTSGAHARADHTHSLGPLLTAALNRLGISTTSTVTNNVTQLVPQGPENVNTVPASDVSQTLPDVSLYTINYVTLTANCVLFFPTIGLGRSFTLVLVQDVTGSRTVTWPANVAWAAGTAPTLTTGAGKRDVFSFMCADGTSWLAFTAGENYS